MDPHARRTDAPRPAVLRTARAGPQAALAAALALAVLIPAGGAYGHGLGLDTATISADGEKISVTVELPMDFDPGQKQLTVTAKQAGTGEAVDVELGLAIIHEGRTVLNDRFAAADGILAAGITPAGGAVEILGTRDDRGAWLDPPDGTLEITGPVFDTPGLYTFEIELFSVDGSVPEGPSAGRADLTVIEAAEFDQKDAADNDVKFRTKSYFDRIYDFAYDHRTGEVTFRMHFDWSERTISHIPVVHEEVHFPKDFVEQFGPSYTGAVNGIKLFKSSVTIDDYTEQDERIVHFVLLSDHLRVLKNQLSDSDTLPDSMTFTLTPNDEIQFPLTAYTAGEQFRVDLSWEPREIEPGRDTNFIFTIRDGATGETLRQSTYDLVIIQDGREIHRAGGEAVVGGSFERYAFAEEQTGPTVIRFENIRGTGAQTEFGLVVVPEFGGLALLVLVAAMISAIVLAGPGIRGVRA